MTAPRIVTGARVCPACGRERNADAVECPFCGVVFSRYRPKLPSSALKEVPDDQPSHHVHISLAGRERLLLAAAQALEAGLSLGHFFRGPALDAFPRSVAIHLRERFDAEGSLAATLDGVIDQGDAAVLVAGETAGKLPAALRALAARYNSAIAARRRLFMATLYPAFLIVGASVVMPAPKIFTAGIGAYLSTALPPLAVVFAAYFVGLVILPRLDPRIGQKLRSVFVYIPPLSIVARARATEVFSRTLSDGVAAGLPIRLAIRLAAEASGHPRVSPHADTFVAAIDGGRGLADTLRGVDFFSASDLAMIAHGELVGRLDEVLPRIADEHGRRARTMTIVLIVAGTIVVLGSVVVVIALAVIDGFMGYLQTMESAVDGIFLGP